MLVSLVATRPNLPAGSDPRAGLRSLGYEWSQVCHDGTGSHDRKRTVSRPHEGDVQEPDERVATATYAPEPAAAAQARRFVRETLRSWSLPGSAEKNTGVIDDAVLLTSEL